MQLMVWQGTDKIHIERFETGMPPHSNCYVRSEEDGGREFLRKLALVVSNRVTFRIGQMRPFTAGSVGWVYEE